MRPTVRFKGKIKVLLHLKYILINVVILCSQTQNLAVTSESEKIDEKKSQWHLCHLQTKRRKQVKTPLLCCDMTSKHLLFMDEHRVHSWFNAAVFLLLGVSTWLSVETFIRLWGYAKRILEKEEVKQQVSTRVHDHSTLSLQDSRHKNNSLVPRTLHLPVAGQHCVFLPARVYHPALLHVPASTLTVVDLTRPCCHTLQGWIVPLAHCELYTSLLWCFIDLRCFSLFQIERLTVPALCSLHIWSFVLCSDQPWKEEKRP